MNQQEINSKSMLRVGTILRGIYRIDSYLSSGGFGNTYMATNIEFDERVAIKEFFMKGVSQRDDNQTTVSVSNSENTNSFLEQKEKFKKEARRIRLLHNEHIISVHDLFEENGTAYYVMDYVDGENLSERLKRTGRAMTENEVIIILPQILDALKAVHDAGIWHLDLKPANIMIEKGGNIKLIDFGASKQLNVQKGGATTSTAISYTNGYAPREQMEQNYDKFGPWTDIYALGATLYNLLTNKRPPLPSDIDDDMNNDKHIALPFLNNVGDNMKRFVLWLMQTNRNNRPQSINEVFPMLKQQFDKTSNKAERTLEEKNEEIENSKTTILATPQSEETIIEKNGVSRLEPTQQQSPTYEDNNNSINSKGNSKFLMIVVMIAIGIVILLLINPDIIFGNEAPPLQESRSSVVEFMSYETPIGGCQFSGSVDEQNRPNGKGEAFFNDGRYYKGNFEHGNLTGTDAYFKYPNGDVFEGEFRNNSFYVGKYTIAKDKSYYIGSYNKGQPSNGTWYDKNGKIIE